VKAYYHARAAEYDDWWLGVGAYAARPPEWDNARDGLIECLETLRPALTLDVACGTGFITQHLPGKVTGLDQSDAMLEIARDRMPDATFVLGDAFDLPFPDNSFERVVASFFYCHLEEPERVRFLAEARRVAPELVVVGTIGREGEERARWDERIVNDGTRWQVYKRVFEPQLLAEELGGEVLHARDHLLVVRA
jgi:demethylmenaquinone methyltransferase/2-methoxy-6-polyprenyl-1,4-benzoquinol methylase